MIEHNIAGAPNAPVFIVRNGPQLWRIRAWHRRDVLAVLNKQRPGWRRMGWTCKKARLMRSRMLYDKAERKAYRWHCQMMAREFLR